MEIQVKNSDRNEYDQIKKDFKFKINHMMKNPKSFGFHINPNNIRISVVLVKRVWKRSRKITKNILKKTFKRETKDEEGAKSETKLKKKKREKKKNVKEAITINPKEFTGERKWCWDDFERHIGVPKRIDTPPSLALAYLRAKRCQRYVPEAKNLRKPDDTDTVFLSLHKKRRNCVCPDHDCLCFNNEIINKTMKIPYNKYNLLNFLKGLITHNKPDMKDLVHKILNETEHTTLEEDEEYKNIILNPQMCLERCRYCLVSEEKNEVLYLPYFLRELLFRKEAQKKDKVEVFKKTDNRPVEERICNIVYCTVGTQTDMGPDGELDTSNFSHILYSNNDETYLPDIRGKKLQITQYTDVSPKGPDMQVCARNMEKFMDFKEMKARFSKLITSIYEIKDPGTPVRTSATQVPWGKRICDSFKIRAPNRCGDEDYDNIPEVPWNYKMHDAILDEAKKDEWEEDENDETCPCCELFARSTQLADDENITVVKNIIEEIVANTFDDIEEIIKKEAKFTEVDSDRDLSINEEEDEEDDTEELEETGTSRKNRNDRESVNKNHLDANISDNDNCKLQSSLTDAGKASDELKRGEIDNNKKRVKCDFLRTKKPKLLSSLKTADQKMSESIAKIVKRKRRIKRLETSIHSKDDNDDVNANEISSDHKLDESEDEENLDLNNDLSKTDLNKKSSHPNSKTRKQQKDASNINNTSKGKIVLQLNTSYKKVSSAFSSLFKWLFGQSILMSQIYKTSSSVSKEIHSTHDAKLNVRDSKNSEKEVFSIRYTSSNISVSKSTSSGNTK